MNTKIAAGAATVAALASVAVGIGLDGPASAHAVTHTLTFKTQQISHKVIGNVDVAANKELQNGAVTGYDATSCRLDLQTHVAHCDVAAARAAGLIYAHVSIHLDTNRGSGVVTGGTRRFAGATGTVTGVNNRITIHWSN